MSHSGYNTRRQISTTQEYKSCSHCVTNVSITEVNVLKNSSTLDVSVPINISVKFDFVPVNGPRVIYYENALRIKYGSVQRQYPDNFDSFEL